MVLAGMFAGTIAAWRVFGQEVTPGAGVTATIRVSFAGVRNSQGQLAVLLFAQAAGFPDDQRRALRRTSVKLRDAAGRALPVEKLMVAFPDLQPGRYAISVLHDEDGDGKMRTNLIGMPREGVGVSNNPPFRLSPPDFTAASFTLDDKDLTLSISLKYF